MTDKEQRMLGLLKIMLDVSRLREEKKEESKNLSGTMMKLINDLDNLPERSRAKILAWDQLRDLAEHTKDEVLLRLYEESADHILDDSMISTILLKAEKLKK